MAKLTIDPKVVQVKELNVGLLKQLQVFQAHPITQKYWALGAAARDLPTPVRTLIPTPEPGTPHLLLIPPQNSS